MSSPYSTSQVRARARRKAMGHQCPSCRTLWALRVITHPSGLVVNCRHCGEVRSIQPRSERHLNLA